MHVYGKCSTKIIYVNINVKQDIMSCNFTPSYNSVKMNGYHFVLVVHNINWNKLHLDEIQKLFYHMYTNHEFSCIDLQINCYSVFKMSCKATMYILHSLWEQSLCRISVDITGSYMLLSQACIPNTIKLN